MKKLFLILFSFVLFSFTGNPLSGQESPYTLQNRQDKEKNDANLLKNNKFVDNNGDGINDFETGRTFDKKTKICEQIRKNNSINYFMEKYVNSVGLSIKKNMNHHKGCRKK